METELRKTICRQLIWKDVEGVYATHTHLITSSPTAASPLHNMEMNICKPNLNKDFVNVKHEVSLSINVMHCIHFAP